MHTEDLQAARQPLHVLDELRVTRVGADLLGRPVGERVGPRAHHAQASVGGGRRDLRDAAAQVSHGLLDRPAHPRDDLDARLEQLVLGLRVLTAMRSAELAEDVARGTTELATVKVDELELPLDAQARPRRGRERNLHERKVPVGRRTCSQRQREAFASASALASSSSMRSSRLLSDPPPSPAPIFSPVSSSRSSSGTSAPSPVTGSRLSSGSPGGEPSFSARSRCSSQIAIQPVPSSLTAVAVAASSKSP